MQTKPTALCPNRQQSTPPVPHPHPAAVNLSTLTHNPHEQPEMFCTARRMGHTRFPMQRTTPSRRTVCVWRKGASNHCDGCWPLKAVFTVLYAYIYLYVYIYVCLCVHIFLHQRQRHSRILPYPSVTFRSVAFCYVTFTNFASHAAAPTPLSPTTGPRHLQRVRAYFF